MPAGSADAETRRRFSSLSCGSTANPIGKPAAVKVCQGLQEQDAVEPTARDRRHVSALGQISLDEGRPGVPGLQEVTG